MNQTVRTVLLWIVILVVVALLAQFVKNASATSEEIPFSQFLDEVAEGRVDQVLIKNEQIFIKTEGGEDAGPRPRPLTAPLVAHGVLVDPGLYHEALIFPDKDSLALPRRYS